MQNSFPITLLIKLMHDKYTYMKPMGKSNGNSSKKYSFKTVSRGDGVAVECGNLLEIAGGAVSRNNHAKKMYSIN